jgi:hypothetical protein
MGRTPIRAKPVLDEEARSMLEFIPHSFYPHSFRSSPSHKRWVFGVDEALDTTGLEGPVVKVDG